MVCARRLSNFPLFFFVGGCDCVSEQALNVLFIVVDDLRPEIGAYGYKHAPPTPNLDRFAKTALKFDRAYVQYSFCCPSRNSFMSGRRPSKTKVWNFQDHFREAGIGADWIRYVSKLGKECCLECVAEKKNPVVLVFKNFVRIARVSSFASLSVQMVSDSIRDANLALI